VQWGGGLVARLTRSKRPPGFYLQYEKAGTKISLYVGTAVILGLLSLLQFALSW
jgi:hypothetical protein